MSIEGLTFSGWGGRGSAHGVHHHGRGEGGLRRLDADRSGAISVEEAAKARPDSRLATGFARIDADGDGQVTRAELSADIRAYRRDGSPRHPEAAEQPAVPPTEPQAGQPPSDAPPEVSAQSLYEALVGAADGNGDLRLSRDELAANPLANLLTAAFDSIDLNGDGLLASREVDAYEDASAAPAPTEPVGEAEEGAADTSVGETAGAADPAPIGGEVAPAGAAVSAELGAGDASSGPVAPTYGTAGAISLYESLFHALAAQPGSATVELGRDAARQFLHLLADIA